MTLAVLDARRGEAFAAAWDPAGVPLLEPVAWPPERLAEAVPSAAAPAMGSPCDEGRLADAPAPPTLGGSASAPPPTLAIGDGAVRFRAGLEAAGATVPDDDSPLHRVSAGALCRLAAAGPPVQRDGLVPHYVRAPDAVPRR